MLVLSRKTRQQIQIGDNVVVTILLVKGNTVRVGIEAPRDVRVLRSELPLHEQNASDAAPQQMEISLADLTVSDDQASVAPVKAKAKSSTRVNATRSNRNGPVLAALRRRGGLGALSPSPSQTESGDLGPIFDHH